MNEHENVKHALDIASISMAFSTVLGLLPTILGCIAAALSILWSLIRFYDRYKGKRGY